MKSTASQLASLRYKRPYWMLHLQGADNWRIYEVIHEPNHARTEMLYQSWLGGLDRPYTRPRCMATQPVWLEKKRHEIELPRLQGPATQLEHYYLDWYRQYDTYGGQRKPTGEDLNVAFDLVQRPLDLSYACKLLDLCRNRYNVHLTEDAFLIFLDACKRVDRLDVAKYALENAEDLGFWHVDEESRRYIESDGKEGAAATTQPKADTKAPASAKPAAEESEEERLLREMEEEERRLAAELESLEAEAAAQDPKKKSK